jgi:hypothetical protein
MSAARVTKVEPQAALELVGLVAGQLRRLIDETGSDQPCLVYLLAGALERLDELNAFEVEQVRVTVWRGRRLDMAEAFNQLNPTFGEPVKAWCYPPGMEDDDAETKAAAQRRELELSMGERFARMFAPACQGGEAA